jgi:hypothetical protein
MKKHKRYRLPAGYSLKNAILDILLDFGEEVTLFDSPYKRMKRDWRQIKGIPEPTRWRFNRAMRYLENVGEIEVVKRKSKIFVKLTKQGKVKALLSKLSGDFKKQPTWDGKWRLIIWDIPEDSRDERDRIRRWIKSLNFYQLQLSVFITPCPLPLSAVSYLRETDLIKYIRFLRVDKLEDDHELRKYFKLLRK